MEIWVPDRRLIPPRPNTRLRWGSPIVSRGLLYAWAMCDGVTGVAQDAFRRGRNITLNSISGITNFKGIAPAYQFNGTSSYASVAVDLSGTSKVSLSFWLRVDTYNSADDLAFELTTNFNSFVTGFIVDPCSSTGSFSCNLRGNGGYNDGRFTRPSAGNWHFYTVIFDHDAAGADEIVVYADGVLQSLTKTNSADNPTSDPFANDTLYIMTRTISSLYLHGSICNILIHNRAITQAEHYWMFLEPYDSWMESEPSIFVGFVGAGGGQVAADGSLSAVSTVSGNATVSYAGTGTIAAASSVSGNAVVALAATGAIAASSTVDGNAALALPVSGTIAASSTVDGNAGLSLPVSGSLAASSTVDGNAIAAWAASGTIAAVSTVDGNATVEGNDEASGSISATSNVSGNAGIGVPASGLIAAQSTVGGNAGLSLPVTGSIAATSTVSGNAVVTKDVSGSISAQSTCSGNAVLAISASGSCVASSICVANGVVLWQTNGLIVAVAVVNGNAQVVSSGNVPGLINVFTELRETQWNEPELEYAFTELERTL